MVRAAAIALALTAGTANAVPQGWQEFYFTGTTGSKLMEVCGTQFWQPGQYDPCGGFLLGIIDGLSFSKKFCPPRGVGNLQLEQIAYEHIKKMPEQWDKPAVWLIEARFRALYPCGAKK